MIHSYFADDKILYMYSVYGILQRLYKIFMTLKERDKFQTL